MSLKSQAFAGQPEQPRGIKFLYFCPDSWARAEPWAPYFYLEARIDYADVRSGYHMTCGLNHVLDLQPYDEDFTLTRDMVRTVASEAMRTTKPEGATLLSLPVYITEDLVQRLETQYLSFLLRHAEARVFRNFALNIYSYPGETHNEFQLRCLDVFKESFRGELESLREVVNRRFERIEQKYISRTRRGEFELDRRVASARSTLHAVAENIAELFLRTELTLESADVTPMRYPDPSRPDVEQSLEILETDVRRDVGRLLNSYQEKIRNIDEYIIHPGLKDLHLVRKCILWMPAGAA